jgi:hypothetical protein
VRGDEPGDPVLDELIDDVVQLIFGIARVLLFQRLKLFSLNLT